MYIQGVEGAQQISSSLHGSKIATLDLSMNEITNEGAMGLFKAIKKRTWLDTLDISANGLDAGLAQDLAELLRDNIPKLTKLDVSCNHFHEVRATMPSSLY